MAEKEKQEALLSENNYRLLDEIRRQQTADKTKLSEASGFSWPTVNKLCEELRNRGYLAKEDLSLLPTVGYMLGIAVGTREIKVSLVDFAFQPVLRKRLRELGLGKLLDRDLLSARNEPKEAEENYICLNSSQDLEKLAETLNDVLLAFLQVAKTSEDTSNLVLPLVGIGIAFPGAVDTKKNQISACPNIPCLNEKNLDSLLCADVRTLLESLDIEVELCHNAEAGFLHEKEQLFHATDPVRRSLAESQNILCVYHGTGIGLSGCMAGRLLRGNNGFFGEIGHILSPDFSLQRLKSECTDAEQAGKIPEDKIPLSGCRCPFCQKTCLESLIRARVFESENLEVFKQKTDRERLRTFAQNEWNFRLLKQYIGFMVGTIINLFNPEVLILTGRLYDCVPEIWNSMNILKSSNSLSYSGSRCTIIPGSKKDNSVAVGAAISAYYHKYSYRTEEINWARH